MSGSRCPKCQGAFFETETEEPKNSNFKLMFVRCSDCKTVVGVLDYYNIGFLLRKLASKMGVNLDY